VRPKSGGTVMRWMILPSRASVHRFAHWHSLLASCVALILAACHPAVLPTFHDTAPAACAATPLPCGRVSVTVHYDDAPPHSGHGFLLSRCLLVTAGHLVAGGSSGETQMTGRITIAKDDPGATAPAVMLGYTVRTVCIPPHMPSGTTNWADYRHVREWPDYAVVELEGDVGWQVPTPCVATRSPCLGDVIVFGIGDRFPVPGVVPAPAPLATGSTVARVWESTTTDRGTRTFVLRESGALPVKGWSGTPAFLWESGCWRLCGVLMSIGELAVNGPLGTTAEAGSGKPGNPTVYSVSAPPHLETEPGVDAAR
jgi:hypothetical protein